MDSMTYKRIALLAGDSMKYGTSVNEINRAAQSVFHFSCENFPVDSITSVRAHTVYNWIMTLAKQSMNIDDRNKQLRRFLEIIVPAEQYDYVMDMLDGEGIIDQGTEKYRDFMGKCFHYLVNEHCHKLFVEGHYFHSVFEAAKVYHKQVQQKANSSKDGQSLMMDVWNPKTGCLKITPCVSDTDNNIQEGIGFLSAGLMRAIRNPTAHEPALDWPIDEKDCLDILSFISFLLRKLDASTYYKCN
jgi:uncharacterized protein (TIGR02391 family)